ncbi:TIGR03749 family integrating conjugative element protein [Gilliamella sp. wkB18]|uniref:TIGR03749 family integrating conjugative element protein n=1 Tax=Gilliamella sp. wkB18 TaxID=3120260 RepID=UPI000ACC4F13|nr:TIGR03749 family integrating conjugative element protein [Gilliamella apicola]
MNKAIIKLTKWLVAMPILMLSLSAGAIELVNWDKTPIKIRINQDDERMVILEKNISVGLPTSLQDKLRVQSLGGVLYLKSKAPFPETRLMLKDLETGEIILVDLTGNSPSKKKLETIKIVTGQITGEDPSTVNKQTLPVPVLLTRYAAQNYYAPMRAIEKVPGIKQISMSLPQMLTRLVPQLPVIAMPQSIWRLKNYDVVAVKLVNQSENYINLDPRLLQGQFYSATFQHNTLGPKGQSTDTTMLYIVTEGKALNAFLPEPVIPSVKADMKTSKKEGKGE